MFFIGALHLVSHLHLIPLLHCSVYMFAFVLYCQHGPPAQGLAQRVRQRGMASSSSAAAAGVAHAGNPVGVRLQALGFGEMPGDARTTIAVDAIRDSRNSDLAAISTMPQQGWWQARIFLHRL